MTAARWRGWGTIVALGLLAEVGGPTAAGSQPIARPSIVFITVDTLRADHVGVYGYRRQTTPFVDQLLLQGVRFAQAYTVEPLTNPAMTSMLTSRPPHINGATRNGLRMREGLSSLPKILASRGWRTAAFVSNWTLKAKLSRLDEHFDHYAEVLTRRRWLGLLKQEATAEDVTDRALAWAQRLRRLSPEAPYFLWAHYSEPHAPYRFWERAGVELGIERGSATKIDRYDTEIRTTDTEIQRLISGLTGQAGSADLLVVFSADHGESLGEHESWGHGRNLYQPSLLIPMGVVWRGWVRPGVLDQAALITDLAPTVLELVGLRVPDEFEGMSWYRALHGENGPERQALCFQAHKGAIQTRHDSQRKRSKGLLEVGVITGHFKEIMELAEGPHHLVFDLAEDPQELRNTAAETDSASLAMMSCLGEITEDLGNLDRLATTRLDETSRNQLKALGYLQ